MFERGSRYYTTESAILRSTSGDGATRLIVYRRRRMLPPPEATTTVLEHTVSEGDRLDNLSARYLGDPLLFWQICDANGVMHPRELTETVGRVVRIGLPRQ